MDGLQSWILKLLIKWWFAPYTSFLLFFTEHLTRWWEGDRFYFHPAQDSRWNPHVLETDDWTTLVSVELRFLGSHLRSCHSLPCFQASLDLFSAPQALLQLDMSLQDGRPSKSTSNFRRRIIIGARCLQNSGIIPCASAQGEVSGAKQCARPHKELQPMSEVSILPKEVKAEHWIALANS